MARTIIDTTSGAGDTLKAGGDKLNAMTLDLYRGFPVAARKTTLIGDGDSKGAEFFEAVTWAMARLRIDGRPKRVDLHISATNSGSGGPSPQHLLYPARLTNIASTIAAEVAAGQTVDYALKIGTNDLTVNPPATIMANVRKLHETVLRPGGVRCLLLIGVDPRNDANYNTLSASVNELYRIYAQANPHDVIYVDTTHWLIDPNPANTLGRFIPYTAVTGLGNYNSGFQDGVHMDNVGKFKINPAFDPYLLRYYRQGVIHDLSQADVWVNTTALNGRVLANSRTVALGGTLDANASTALTVTGTPPLGYILQSSTAAATGLTVAFTVAECAYLNALYGTTGFKCVNMAFSGTAAADVKLTMDAGLDLYRPTAETLLEWTIGFNNLQNLCQLGSQNQWDTLGPLGVTGVGLVPYPNINGLYDFETEIVTRASPFPNNTHSTFFFQFKSGLAVTGSVDLIAFGPRLVGPLPAATP